MAKKKTTRKSAKKTDKTDAGLEPEGDCCEEEEDTRSAAQESARGAMHALLDVTRNKNVEAALINIVDASKNLKKFPKKLPKKKLRSLSRDDVYDWFSDLSDIQALLTSALQCFSIAEEMTTLTEHVEELDFANPKIKI